MPGRMEFKLDLGRAAHPQETGRRRGPMRLLVLGDFSGKPVAERPPLADRPTQRVDRDNLDDVIQRLAPRLTLAAGELRFEQIDDFHPDALYTRFELFDTLRQARAQPPASGGDLLGSLLGKPGGATRGAGGVDARRGHRRLHPCHRRAAHRAGHVGTDRALPGGGRRGRRRADAQAAPRPGLPAPRIRLARRAMADHRAWSSTRTCSCTSST